MLHLREPLYEEEGGGGASPTVPDRPGWIAQVADEFKEDTSLHEFGNITALVKAYKGLGEQLSKVERAPESAEAYEFDDLEIPEAIREVYDPKMTAEEIRTVAHELGLSVDKAKKLFGIVAQREMKAVEAQTASARDAEAEELGKAKAVETELRQEWGDNYDGEIGIIAKVAKTFFGDDFAKIMNEAGYGNSSAMMRGLNKIGHAMSEDAFIEGERSTGNPNSRASLLEKMYGGSTPAEGAGFKEMMAQINAAEEA